MRTPAFLVLALSSALNLYGCHSTSTHIMPVGERVGAPVGAVDYCHRHPQDEKCK